MSTDVKADWQQAAIACHREALRQAREKADEFKRYLGERLVETLEGLGVPARIGDVDVAGERPTLTIDGVTFGVVGRASDWYPTYYRAQLLGRCPRCFEPVWSGDIEGVGALGALLEAFDPGYEHDSECLARATAVVRQDCTPVEGRLLQAMVDWLEAHR